MKCRKRRDVGETDVCYECCRIVKRNPCHVFHDVRLVLSSTVLTITITLLIFIVYDRFPNYSERCATQSIDSSFSTAVQWKKTIHYKLENVIGEHKIAGPIDVSVFSVQRARTPLTLSDRYESPYEVYRLTFGIRFFF